MRSNADSTVFRTVYQRAIMTNGNLKIEYTSEFMAKCLRRADVLSDVRIESK